MFGSNARKIAKLEENVRDLVSAFSDQIKINYLFTEELAKLKDRADEPCEQCLQEGD
jgi:hypothetical protein